MAEELDPTSSEAVSRRYRELSAEEPPRALDEAILAAARREAGAGPAAQYAPSARSSRQRWYAPLAAAAVLVLAVAVTLQMQIERPGIESPAPQAAAPRADRPAATPATEAELKLKVDAQFKSARTQAAREMAPAPSKPAEPAAPASTARVPQPFAANQAAGAASRSDDTRAAVSSVTGERARQMEERISRDAEAGARAPRLGAFQAQAGRAESSAPAEIAKSADAQAAPQAQKQAESPERELERIAQLRAQGRHDEADRALAEFRKRYPDYKIPDAMRERIERR